MIKHPKSTQLFLDWQTNPRWKNIRRPYNPEDVLKLRSKVEIEYTLARKGAEKLWKKLCSQSYVAALGALTGNQAVQEVAAGLEAIYLSGWQVAADANRLPKNEQQEEVADADEHRHREYEQANVGEEPPVAAIALHVA